MERVAKCHCGALRATTRGEPLLVAICHCKACQQRTGAIAASVAGFAKDQVSVEGDTKNLQPTGRLWTGSSFSFLPELRNVPVLGS
jgi:hypothetical protein